ncbi:MAG: hypothetical protein EHM89_07030 [Acidobacteria bacterium]|nr:MAG: hypothetical protein EHM89_07030 [Acidobacteriota bacterium]
MPSLSDRMLRLLGSCLLVVFMGSDTLAQTSKSAPLAAELAKLLEAGKLDAIAARQESEPDRFVAALYFPGQLLVVSARYMVPPILVAHVEKKNYRDVYVDLNGAQIPETKIFIDDVGADGLTVEKGAGADSYERGSKIRWIFNGQWRQQKIASEAEYKKNFEAADSEYAEILSALIQQAKK